MLSKGVPPDVADEDGWQPMHWVCMNGYLALAQWLHAFGAPLDVATKGGDTPAALAPSGNPAIVAWLADPALPAELIKERAQHRLARWRAEWWPAWRVCNYLWRLYGERQGAIDGAFGRRAAAAFKADQEAGMSGV